MSTVSEIFSFEPAEPASSKRRYCTALDALQAQHAAKIARRSALRAARESLKAAKLFGFRCDLRNVVACTTSDANYNVPVPVSAVEDKLTSVDVQSSVDTDKPADFIIALTEKRSIANVSLAPRLYVSPAIARAMRAD